MPTPDSIACFALQPTLTSSRLILRPYADNDDAAISRYCADRQVAEHTLTIPHPYPAGEAAAAIARFRASWADGSGAVWGISVRSDGEIVGGIGLRIEVAHERAEVGYAIGVKDWGRGYATEAVRAVLRYAFIDREPQLQRVHAGWYAENPASGRVLEKCGFLREGLQRRHAIRFGRVKDLVLVGLLREEYLAIAGH